MTALAGIGVDVGGTFTDVVLEAPGRGTFSAKVPTTPDDPRRGIERGLREVLEASSVPPGDIARLVHGTTRATNLILERKGARTAFVATAGFRHMLELGREARVESDRYDLFFSKPQPPVEAALTFEVNERIDARGEVVNMNHSVAPNPLEVHRDHQPVLMDVLRVTGQSEVCDLSRREVEDVNDSSILDITIAVEVL